MISVAFYERFALPYVRAMIEEIHALGKKAVLIYFGGVSDRLAQIGSLDADALSVETSMKTYTNDLGEIGAQLGDRLCLWGNIDPVGIVQDGTEDLLAVAVQEQVAIGRRLGRFIVSTGSPPHPVDATLADAAVHRVGARAGADNVILGARPSPLPDGRGSETSDQQPVTSNALQSGSHDDEYGSSSPRLFPLGSHLCRLPMPALSELKADMENLKRHGFNLVKLQEHWGLG